MLHRPVLKDGVGSLQPRWLVAASIMAMSGCGTGATSVSGMVTMDGQPLGQALVRFFPSGPVGQTAATSPLPSAAKARSSRRLHCGS
jgi:hypothetical protein